MYVRDLEATRQFFVRFFGAVCGEPYHNPRTGLRSCFLRFGDGARLEIMHRPDMTDPRKEPLRSGYIHLAFGTGSREAGERVPHRQRPAHHGRRLLRELRGGTRGEPDRDHGISAYAPAEPSASLP
mgnify:CR=1 FL=1